MDINGESIDNDFSGSITVSGQITAEQLTVDEVDINDGIITMSGTSGNNQIVITDNVADGFSIKGSDATNYLTLDTTNSSEQVNITQNLDVSGGGAVSFTTNKRIQCATGIGASNNTVLIGDSTTGAVMEGTANLNVCIGVGAGSNITTGDTNLCLGSSSNVVATSSNQIAIGYLATTTTNNQCKIGNSSLASVEPHSGASCDLGASGSEWTDLYLSGKIDIEEGNNNIIIGNGSGATLISGATGSNTTVVGCDAYTEGDNFGCTIMGSSAGEFINAGDNTAFGYAALKGTTLVSIGSGNTALGASALTAIKGGTNNVGLGRDALLAVEGGTNNVGVGYLAGSSLVDNNFNTFCGNACGQYIVANTNTAVGSGALKGHETLSTSAAANNAAVGNNCLSGITEGFQNTGVGNRALDALTEGQANVAIGYQAGDTITTENNNTFIGAYADGTATFANQTAIGYGAVCDATHQVTIGNSNVTKIRPLSTDGKCDLGDTTNYFGDLTCTNLIANDLDSRTATTLALGKATATKVEVGASDITTEVLGAFTFPQPVGEAYVNGNASTTTISTTQTWTRLSAGTGPTTSAGRLKSYTHTSPGLLTYTGTPTKYSHIGVTIVISPGTSADINWHIGIYKNGGVNPSGEFTSGSLVSGSKVALHTITNGHMYSTAIHCMTQMSTNDTLEVAIWNDDGTQNLTVVDLNLFSIHMAAD